MKNNFNKDLLLDENMESTLSTTMNVIKRDGKSESMDYGKVIKRVNHLSEDLGHAKIATTDQIYIQTNIKERAKSGAKRKI